MFCDEILPSFFSSYSWNTHPFCSSPGMCLKTVTHVPPPLSPDRVISCILFQLGISRELRFFVEKRSWMKERWGKLVLLQRDIYIYRIKMLAILRYHPANRVTHIVNGCLFSRQIGEGGSWRAQEVWLPGRKGDAETRTGLEKINAEVKVNRTKHRNFWF